MNTESLEVHSTPKTGVAIYVNFLKSGGKARREKQVCGVSRNEKAPYSCVRPGGGMERRRSLWSGRAMFPHRHGSYQGHKFGKGSFGPGLLFQVEQRKGKGQSGRRRCQG